MWIVAFRRIRAVCYIQSSELGVTVKLLDTPLATEATSPVISCVLTEADQHEAFMKIQSIQRGSTYVPPELKV